MDDDTIPSPKALEALMQTATQSNDIGFVCSKVLWTDNTLHPRNIPGGLKKRTPSKNNGITAYRCEVCTFVSAFWSAVVRSTRLACPSKSSLSGSMISNTRSESQEPDSKITIQNKALSYTRLRTCTTRISNRHRSIWPNDFYYQTRNTCYFKHREQPNKLLFRLSIWNKLRILKRRINRRKDGHKQEFLDAIKKGCHDGLTFYPKIEYLPL